MITPIFSVIFGNVTVLTFVTFTFIYLSRTNLGYFSNVLVTSARFAYATLVRFKTKTWRNVREKTCQVTKIMKLNLTQLISEISARLFLLILFLISEKLTPFQRLIHQEELWLYQNPTTKSYVTSMHLWLFIVFPLPFLPLFYHILCYKFQNRFGKMENSYRKNDLLSGILATTLLLPLNGVVTNFIKLTVGRPRPDFAYR